MDIKRILTCITVLFMTNVCMQAQTSSLTIFDLPKIEKEQQYKEILSQLKRPLVIMFNLPGCRPARDYKRDVILYMYKYHPELADYYILDVKEGLFSERIAHSFGIHLYPVTQVVYNKKRDGLFTKTGYKSVDSIQARSELKFLINRVSDEIDRQKR